MSGSIRAGVDSFVGGLQSATHFWSASRAPLDAHGAHPIPSLLRRSLEDIRNVVDEGPPFSLSDLPAYIDAVTNIGGTIDDRKFLLECILTLMARLGDDSEFSSRLQQVVINILYKDLPHPPGSYLALPSPGLLVGNAHQPGGATQPVDHAYRSADGAHYNPLMPSLGMAGSPYARSVASQRCLPSAALPPADLVFDTLLKRDKFVEHPGGISSLFFAFADIIIHNIFDTDPAVRGWTTNRASSYLDLSPLYGSSREAVNSVRRHDGTGRLHEDVFADPRLLNMPPAVCVLLVIFNRNHNYVAEKILTINENGNFKNPPPADPPARASQDEEIFQRARLVNTGFFVQVILRDYVGAILGLARDGSPWRLDPLMSTRDPDHDVSPRGQGNVVSVEFNLLYRWHATVSEEDERWTERHFAETMPGIDPRTASVRDFVTNVAHVLGSGGDVTQRTFGGLRRDDSGRFNDADLARILQNATAAPASAFKARGTPEVLRVIEVLSIEQGRKWGVCTLNEFRKFIGLRPYASFEEWNEDREIADAAEALYHDIDNLELYVGLQAEQAKEPRPGAGLCPGFTISRAILSDAVALTRGDRFLTVDYTPKNLTSWGYDDCQANLSDGSFGGMLTKLLFRHLPDHYPSGSSYAHFPFLVPGKMKGFAQKLPGNVDLKYDWNRPAAPAGPRVEATSYSEVQQLLANPALTSGVAQRLEILTGGVPLNRYTTLVGDVLTRQSSLETTTKAFERITENLIKQRASKGASPHLDLVREVINLVPVHWLSNNIIGLPLKNGKNPGGVFTEQELYTSFAKVANYVYCNKDRSNEWVLREQSQKAVRDVEQYLRGHLARLTRGLVNIEGITDSVLRWVSMWNDHSDNFLKDLVEATGSQSGNSALDGLAGSVLASVVPTAALFSLIIAHVVDFYIGTDGARQIVQLAERRANAQIMPFIFEALRLNPPLSSVLLKAQSPAEFAGTVVAERQHVLASIIDATRDASSFEDPETPNYERPLADIERVLGLDRRGLLSPKMFERVAPIVLEQIFKLKNLRRYSPQSGPMPRCTERIHTVPEKFYTDLNGRVTPFPVSLLVQFDT